MEELKEIKADTELEKLIKEPNEKLKILSSLYTVTIGEMTDIRNTMTKILASVIALMALVTGWIVTKNGEPVFGDRKYFFIGAIIFVYFCAIAYTRVIHRYFNDVASVINNIENIYLGFEKQAYIIDRELLPKRWKKFGKPGWREPIFYMAYAIFTGIAIGSVYVICTWSSKGS